MTTSRRLPAAKLCENATSCCPSCDFVKLITGVSTLPTTPKSFHNSPLHPKITHNNVHDDNVHEHHQESAAAFTEEAMNLSIHVTEWDDGHIPECFVRAQEEHQHHHHHHHQQQQQQQQQESSHPLNQQRASAGHCCGGSKTRMVHYNSHRGSPIETEPESTKPPAVVIHVVDQVVPLKLVDALYDWTVSLDRPWGTYVTLDQVQDCWNNNNNNNHDNDNDINKQPNHHDSPMSQQDLALQAVAHFCRHGLTSQHPSMILTANSETSNTSATTTTSTTTSTLTSTAPIVSWQQLLEEAHGVAIWALASVEGSQVPYHLDYAEQIRYDTNVICPPLYAGTLQCSKTIGNDKKERGCDDRDENSSNRNNETTNSQHVMKGGDFWVNVGGLDHYQQYGYKGALVSKSKRTNTSRNKYDDDALQVGDSSDAYFPPLSLAEEEITDPSSSSSSSSNHNNHGWVCVPFSYNRIICHKGDLPHFSTKVEALPPNTKRVIVGFNVFPRGVIGERVQQAPEHSNAFRRKVQLQRFWLLQEAKVSSADATTTITTTPSTSTTSQPQQHENSDIINRHDNSNVRRVFDSSNPTLTTTTTKPHGKVFTLNMIQSNKSLTKLFVLAKRQRMQNLFRQARAKLERDILQLVWQRQQQQENNACSIQPTSVAYLMEQLGGCAKKMNKPLVITTPTLVQPEEGDQENNKSNGDDLLLAWPKPLDVQVQVHHMLLSSSSLGPSLLSNKSHTTTTSSTILTTFCGDDLESTTTSHIRLVRWHEPNDANNDTKMTSKKELVTADALVYVVVDKRE